MTTIHIFRYMMKKACICKRIARTNLLFFICTQPKTPGPELIESPVETSMIFE